MYMKYDIWSTSSVDAILVVFADLFTKEADKRKTFPCAVAWNITSCEFRREYDTPGWISKSKQSIQICDGQAELISLHL